VVIEGGAAPTPFREALIVEPFARVNVKALMNVCDAVGVKVTVPLILWPDWSATADGGELSQ
jgi:hypothetical protein